MTGVECDFRAFDIAIEQVMRLNAGLQSVNSTTTADNAGTPTEVAKAVNKYLDAAMQISAGTSTQKDPWGNAYTISYTKGTDVVTVTSGGPDGATSTGDNIVLTVKYKDGKIGAKTSGLDNDMTWDTSFDS